MTRSGLELYRFGICSSCEAAPRLRCLNLCQGCNRREIDRARSLSGRPPITDAELTRYGQTGPAARCPIPDWDAYVRGVKDGSIGEAAAGVLAWIEART